MQKASDIASNPQATSGKRTWLKPVLRFLAWWFSFLRCLGLFPYAQFAVRLVAPAERLVRVCQVEYLRH